MAKKFKLPKNAMLWVIGILFAMSVIPGNGEKAADQQAIVVSDYICTTSADCPVCVGAGLFEVNETLGTDLPFGQELSYAECVAGKCEMSEYCLVWDCPADSMLETEDGNVACSSIKQTVLDNTIGRLSGNPLLIIGIVGGIIVFLML